MWGQCRGQAVTSPMETKFTNVDSIFACFASPPSMFRPLIVGEYHHVHAFIYIVTTALSITDILFSIG